jgi:magnesium and cobalt transporter
MNEPAKPSLLERLSTLLLREPEDREQLIGLLHTRSSAASSTPRRCR